MKKLNRAIFVFSFAIFSISGYANSTVHNHRNHMEQPVQPTITTEGKLISIDKENKKLTINHQAIESIGWPPMTMRFTYEDIKMIEGLSNNDELIFSFQQEGNISLLKTIEKKN